VQVAAVDDGRVPIVVETVIWLEVSEDVAVQRLRRRALASLRDDDTPRIARARLGLVAETVAMVRRLYERRGVLDVVDAHATPEDVYASVARYLVTSPRILDPA
jgi:adenylate kinase family enzyme